METNEIKDFFSDMIAQLQFIQREKDEKFERYRELVRNEVRAMTKQRENFYEAWDKKSRDTQLKQSVSLADKPVHEISREDTLIVVAEENENSEDESHEKAKDIFDKFIEQRKIQSRKSLSRQHNHRQKTMLEIQNLYQELGIDDSIDPIV